MCLFQKQVATDVFNNSRTAESQFQQDIQILIYIKKIHCLIASANQKANVPLCYCKLTQPYRNLQAKDVLTLEQVNCLEENKFLRSEKSHLLITETLTGQSPIKYQKQNFFHE